MVIEMLLSSFVIILTGFFWQKYHSEAKKFFDKAVELVYHVFIPVNIIWGILRCEGFPFFTSQFGWLLVLTPLVAFVLTFYLSAVDSNQPTTIRRCLTSLIQASIPLGLSLAAILVSPYHFFQISIFTMFTVPAIANLLEVKTAPIAIITKLKPSRDTWGFFIQKITINPIVLVGGFGLLLKSNDGWLSLIVMKSSELLQSATLPFCCLVIGAKFCEILRIRF